MIIKQFVFSIRNLTRHKLRSCISLLIIMVCTVVIILIGGFYDFLFQDMENNLIAEQGHISITSEKTEISDFKKIDTYLFGDESIQIAFPRLWVNGLVGFEDRSAIFAGEALFYDRERRVQELFIESSGLESVEVNNGVVLGATLASNLGVKPGDIINLVVDFHGTSFEVDDVIHTDSKELDRNYIKLPLDSMFELLGTSDVESWHIIVKDLNDLDAVQERLTRWLADEGYDYRIDNYNASDSYFKSVINIYNNNFIFVLIAILVTNFLAISNTLSMSIMERVKELGVMRSFGTGKMYIMSMFVYEGFSLGLIGFLLGLAVGVLTIVIVNLNNGIYIPPPPTTETGFYAKIFLSSESVLIAFLSSTIVSVLSSLIVSMKIMSMKIMDKLRYV